MSSKSFYGGMAAGIFTGAALALVLPKLIDFKSHCRQQHSPLENDDWFRGTEEHPKFVSRRDNPDSGGDPYSFTGENFTRSGGAPGGKAEPAEQMPVPGRQGQYVDPNRKMEVAPRTVDLGHHESGS